MLKKSKLPEV